MIPAFTYKNLKEGNIFYSKATLTIPELHLFFLRMKVSYILEQAILKVVVLFNLLRTYL